MLNYNQLTQEADNVYYNIQVVNKNENATEFRYSDKQSYNLINSGYRYKLAVERFSIDTSEIPIMYFPSSQFSFFALNSDYLTADNNYYSVTIVDSLGVVYQSYLEHQSFNDANVNDLRIWTIDQFLQILNLAVRNACYNTNVNNNKVPYFIYDRDRAIIDIYFPEEFANLIATHKFYMNKKLWGLFGNFSHTKTNLDQGRDYRIDVYLCGGNAGVNEIVHSRNAVINTSSGADCIIVRGYYCTIYKLHQMRNLIFTTNALPIRAEFLGNSFDFVNGQSNNSDKILKNFEFSLENQDALYTRSIQNFTVSEPEYIDLEDSKEIKNIDLQIYYSDVHGKVHPLLVPSDSLTTVKLLFKKFD